MHIPGLKAPNLWPPIGLSERETEAARLMDASVLSLRYHVEGFAATLELYRFSRSRPANVKPQVAWDWQWIAIHDAAMRIWFLRDAMEILRNHRVPACASIAPHVDSAAMEGAVSLFDRHFPEFKKMRNAVAHAPGLELTGKGPIAADGLYAGPQLKDGDRFELMNGGVRYSMEMTDATLRKLSEILLAFWSSFSPVEQAFDRFGRSE